MYRHPEKMNLAFVGLILTATSHSAQCVTLSSVGKAATTHNASYLDISEYLATSICI